MGEENMQGTVHDAYVRGMDVGETVGKASAATTALKYLNAEELLDSSSLSAFNEGFEKGKKKGCISMLIIVLQLFGLSRKEIVEKAEELSGFSAYDIGKILDEIEKNGVK